MRKLLILLALNAALAVASLASTAVSGVGVHDANGNLYSSGTVSAFIVLAAGQPLPAGATLSSGPFSIDSAASFTISLFSPASYQFTVCGTPVNLGPRANAAPNSVCFTAGPIAVSGGSQDISITLNAAAVLLGPPTGVTGGSPGGLTTQTQVNVAGTFQGTGCQTFPDNVIGPINQDCDVHPKGPNPFVDPTRYGVRALASFTAIPAVAGITGTINNGSTSLAVSTNFCGSQAGNVCFVNGDGIAVVGAGPAHSMTTPVIASVTPSVASGPEGTNTVVNGPTGATTYNYKIVSVDKGRGMTVPSAAVSTTVGQASLGMQSAAITSCTRAGVTMTCLTAAQTLAAGALVYIGQPSDGTFGGWYRTATVPDSTHFTYISGFDTASGATTSSTGGTVIWYNENFIQWIHPPTGAAPQQYIVCSDRGGGGFVPIGISKVDNSANSGTDLALAFDDLGSPAMDNFIVPYWAVNACTAGAAQADELVTTIVGGAGTATLTLAAAASTSVAALPVLFDNTPNFITAATASRQGPLNVPNTTSTFVFNSYMVLPNFTNICQLGAILINDTVELVSGGRWSGKCPPANTSVQTFAWEGNPSVNVGPAYPGFYSRAGTVNVSSINFRSMAGNQQILFLIDPGGVPSGTLSDLNFSTDNVGDYTGMGLFIRAAGINSVNNLVMSGKFSFIGRSGTGANGSTSAPLFYCQGGIELDNLVFAKRGIAFKSGNSGSGTEIIRNIYMNGGVAPLVMYVSAGTTLLFHFGLVSEDTVPHPFFVNLTNNTTKLAIDDLTTGPGTDGVSTPPVVSGNLPSLGVVGTTVGAGYTGAIAGGNFTNGQVQVNGTAGTVGYVLPPPTTPTVAISGGVGPPAATYTYSLFGLDYFGNLSPLSLASIPITVNGSQGVLVTWSLQPGQVRTTVCRGSVCPSSGAGFQILGTSFLDNGSYFPSVSASALVSSAVQSGATSKGLETQTLVLNGQPITSPDAAYDNFNRANGAIGANWTIQVNGINVSGNTIVGTNAGHNEAFYNQLPSPMSTNQFAEATVSNLAGFIGPTVNAQGLTSTYYACLEGSGSLNLQKGASTNLATASPTTAVGDVLRIENNPNASPNLKCTLTSALGVVTTLTATDNTNTGGAPGVTLNGTIGTLDNWSGGVLHPFAQLDVEQDWAQSQHFISPITVGPPTGGLAGALPPNSITAPVRVAAESTCPTGVASQFLDCDDSATHTHSYNANNQGLTSFSGAWSCTNVTPVTVTANVATDQNLMSCTIPAGVLNRALRTLKVSIAGVYSTPAASTTAVTIKVKVGALTVAIWTSTALAGVQATNDQFNIQDAKFTVQTAGATAAFEAHGSLIIDLGVGNTVADSVFADVNTATVGTVDLTASQTLQVTIAFSVASASNSATERQLILETVN